MHGIIIAGAVEGRQPYSESFQYTDNSSKYQHYTAIKRAAGAYRIASFLRENDWDIEVMDYMTAWTEDEFKEFFKQRITPQTKFVAVSQLFYIGEYTKIINARLEWIKTNYPHVTTITGSKDQSIIHWINADYHITGYGEYGMIKLLQYLCNNIPYSDLNVQQIEWFGTIRNVINCDTYHPAYPCKDLQVKYENRDYIESDEILTLELARGCKFKCKFCSFNVLGVKGDYSREMNNLKEELQRNYTLWGTTMYNIADETVNDNPDKLKNARDVIKELNFQPHMFGFVRADLFVSRKDDYKYMAEMGFWGHFYGIETLNHKSGSYVGKGLNPDKMKEGLIHMQKEFPKYSPGGYYKVSVGTICGLPYENNETYEKNYKWLIDNMPYHSIFANPLDIKNDTGNQIATTKSEFDETWRSSGHFRETTLEKLGADPEKLPGSARDKAQMWRRITNDSNLVWETDHNDWWNANLTTANITCNSDYGRDFSPPMWYLQKWLTGQNNEFSLEDVHKPIRIIGGYTDERYENHIKRIESYKQKKLSL